MSQMLKPDLFPEPALPEIGALDDERPTARLGPVVGAGFDIEARAEQLAPVLARFSPREPSAAYWRIRRLVDITAVILLMPAALALVTLGAVALKLEEAGAPVFYRQKRTGYRCRRFEVTKLRSMVTNADDLKASLADQNLRTGPDFKVEDDPRITRVGKILRRTSIDECPQLLSVLRGDMTLIGPRPTSLDVSAYEPWQLERFEVPGGLTGLWQVTARDSESWEDRLCLDIAYARRACVALDCWILWRTVSVVIKGIGST